MLAIAFASISLAGALGAPGDWTSVDAARATGIERIAGGADRPFAVLRDKRQILIETQRGVDGQLSGLLRSELITSQGIYTWLDGASGFSLRLPSVSAPEFLDVLSPIRYTKDQLTSGKASLQRELGVTITQREDGQIGNRTCYVFDMADRSSMVKEFWIDRETGMVLREADWVGRDQVYDRQVTNLEIAATLPAASFSMPGKVIRGAVTPDILVRATLAKSESDYTMDVDQAKGQSRTWVKRLPMPAGFGYAGTTLRESQYSDSPPKRQMPSMYRNPVSGPPVPAEWLVPGSMVFLPDGSLYIDTRSQSTSGARGVFSDTVTLYPNSPDIPGNNDPVFGAIGAGGLNITTIPQPDPQAAKKDKEAPPADADADIHTIVQSDFLDKETGDTVSFIQLRHLPTQGLFRAWSFGSPVTKTTGGRTLYEYVAKKPYALNVIQWQTGGTTYILASSKLSNADLEKLAANL